MKFRERTSYYFIPCSDIDVVVDRAHRILYCLRDLKEPQDSPAVEEIIKQIKDICRILEEQVDNNNE